MLKSMTAMGEGRLHDERGEFVLTLQSLNRKFLDVVCQFPPEWAPLEGEVRKWIGAKVAKGRIAATLFVRYPETTPLSVTPNLPLAKGYLEASKTVAHSLDLPFDSNAFWHLLLRTEGVFTPSAPLLERETALPSLRAVVDLALEELMAMKRVEGAPLALDMEQRLTQLEEWREEVAAWAPVCVEQQRQKLHERLAAAGVSLEGAEEVVLREVLLFAEKSDIAEELVRLASHAEQVKHLLHTEGEPVGDKLDFLFQEMHREWSTIGAKAPDERIKRRGIDAKVELKRLREQVQNVE